MKKSDPKKHRRGMNEFINDFEKLRISLCSHCHSMTYTVKGKCGKCKQKKKN